MITLDMTHGSWPPDDSLVPSSRQSREHPVDRLDRKLREVNRKLKATEVDTKLVAKSVSDFESIKKNFGWLVKFLLPMLVGGAVTLVQSHQRQKILEKQMENYRSRAFQIETDMNGARSDVRVLRVKGETRDEALQEIRDALKRIEEDGVTIRRRSRKRR